MLSLSGVTSASMLRFVSGMLRSNLLRDPRQFLPGLFNRHSIFKPRDDIMIIAAAIQPVLGQRQRQPRLRALRQPKDRVVKVGRHHADNLVGLPVQFRGPAENVSFTAKASLPQVVTQHNDGSRLRAIFFRTENVRPSIGGTPSVSKYPAETCCINGVSGSSKLVSVFEIFSATPMFSNDLLIRRQSE